MLAPEKVRAGAVITIKKLAVELPETVSFTVTSTGNVPAVVGVPAMVLPDANSPGAPTDIDQCGSVHAAPSQVAVKLVL